MASPPPHTPSTIPRISRLPFLRTGHSSRDTKAYITRPPPDDTPFTTLWTFFFSFSIKPLTLEPQHLIFSVAITYHQNASHAYLSVTFVSNRLHAPLPTFNFPPQGLTLGLYFSGSSSVLSLPTSVTIGVSYETRLALCFIACFVCCVLFFSLFSSRLCLLEPLARSI